MKTTVHVSAYAQATPEKAYRTTVPVPLARIFTGYGPLPAVTGTSGQTGDWNAAGETRVVRLSDGSEAREELIALTPPERFDYRVHGFTGSLRFLAREARGEWRFIPDAGRTRIEWSYTFYSTSALSYPAMWLVNHTLWRGYMKRALRRTVALIEEPDIAPETDAR
jgi:hypothetical protein